MITIPNKLRRSLLSKQFVAFIAAQAEEQVSAKIKEGVYMFAAGRATSLDEEKVSGTPGYLCDFTHF